jgi:hypothetical protein
MRTKRLLPAIALLVLASAAAGSAHAAAPTQALDPAVQSQPGDICKNGHTNYYWTLENRFVGQESFRVICTPAGCEGGWKPISVTMYLYWEEENSCALTVQAEIHEVDTTDPSRSTQGRLVAVSEEKTVGPFRPAGLWAVTVAMPIDSPPINGPCFASIRFLDTCDELPYIVAAPGACEAMQSWSDTGEGWTDMLDLDLPGNLTAYASFECQRTSEDETVGWGTIKSMYKTDE